MSKYYDGTKLLSLMDLNGEKPEIYICTSNRTGGKTTYFSRLLVNRFINKGEKFVLLYRFKYELDGCADKFFKDINGLFFPEYEMTSKNFAKGVFHELYLNEIPCGYALTLNSADQIKKYSHFFSDVKSIMFDEFQSETGHYCNDEVTKFLSIHKSIARGQGEMVRRVPVYMISNPITLTNPYYLELGITERLNDKTKFLRGNGFVLEQGYVEAASEAQKESGVSKAFSKNKYIAYASQAVYLDDSKAFIEKPTGKNKYLLTLVYDGYSYGIREFYEKGVVYCDNRPDEKAPLKITVTTDDHEINYIMLERHDLIISQMRFYFNQGLFRFKDMRCKQAVLKALFYNVK